jgi:tetratricopeptide (TPR) repeat protein
MTLNQSNQNHTLATIQNLMRQARFKEAIEASEILIRNDQDNLDAQYFRAVCERKLGDHLKALESLNAIVKRDTQYARAYQEKGYNFQALGKVAEASLEFQQAVKINPTLLASWRVLASEPTYPDRDLARRHADRLSSMPPELVSVSSFMYQDKLHKAEQLCRSFLKRNPQHVEGMRLLAEIALKFNILDDAEYLLESALAFKPDFSHARYDFIQVLHKRQRFNASLEQAKILHAQDPENPSRLLLTLRAL